MSSDGGYLSKRIDGMLTTAATTKLDQWVKGHKQAVEDSRSMGRTPKWCSEIIASTYDPAKPLVKDGIELGVKEGKKRLPRLAVAAASTVA